MYSRTVDVFHCYMKDFGHCLEVFHQYIEAFGLHVDVFHRCMEAFLPSSVWRWQLLLSNLSSREPTITTVAVSESMAWYNETFPERGPGLARSRPVPPLLHPQLPVLLREPRLRRLGID